MRAGTTPKRGAWLEAAAGVVAAAVLLPVVYLVVRAFQAGPGVLASALITRRTLGLLVATATLTAAVTVAATLLGTFVAWVTARSDLRWRRGWTVLCALPLVVPSYVAAFAFISAFGPRGSLQQSLERFGVDRMPEMYGFTGAWLVLTLLTYPYVMLMVRGALAGADPSLEEASLTMSRGRWQTFLKVVLPQIRPGVASGALLVALYTLHDFGAVSLLRYDTFTRAIYLQYQASFDRSVAAGLSIVLVAMTLAVLAMESRIRKTAPLFRVHGSGGRAARVSPLGAYRAPTVLILGLIVLLALGTPVWVSLYWLMHGIAQGLEVGFTASAAGNSLWASLLGAVAATAAGAIIAFAARRRSAVAAFSERTAYIGFALPGVVVALALVFFSLRVVPSMYQTTALLTFAYVILFLPQASGSIASSLSQLSPRIEEAAATLGAGRARRLGKVVIPMIAPGTAAGAALVFLTAMKELPATLLLAPLGFQTLATRVWGATSQASYSAAAGPALALIAFSSIPLAILLAPRFLTGAKGAASPLSPAPLASNQETSTMRDALSKVDLRNEVK